MGEVSADPDTAADIVLALGNWTGIEDIADPYVDLDGGLADYSVTVIPDGTVTATTEHTVTVASPLGETRSNVLTPPQATDDTLDPLIRSRAEMTGTSLRTWNLTNSDT